jgi:putative ABC transport system permease protein
MNRLLAEIAARLRAWRRGDAADRDTRDELAYHLDMEAEKLMAAGVPPADARRRARLALGGVDAIREEARDARGGRWLDDLIRDVRVGVRQLRRSPAFTVVAVATLGLGIGATTAIWSVIDGVLLQPLPFHDADRLVVVWQTDRRTGTTREPASWPDYLDFRAQAGSLTNAAAVRGTDITVSGSGAAPVRAAAAAVTATYFGLLGIDPVLGRVFTDAEAVPGGPQIAMLG